MDPLEQAMKLMEAGRFAEADATLRAVLLEVPTHPGALCLRGICLAEQGRRVDAITLLEQAVALAPDFADAHENLAFLFMREGRLDDAERSFRRVIVLAPVSPVAYANLGVVLSRKGRSEEAIDVLRNAVSRDPSNPAFAKLLGDALYLAKNGAEALIHHKSAIDLWTGPSDPIFFEHVWRTFTTADRREDALAVARKWLSLEPRSPIALHCVAASGGATAPDRASDGYVKGTFDAFASTFDEQLGTVGYRGPTLVAPALRAVCPEQVARGLDAGCGTGLCGELLRPLAKTLIGVDLSTKMLEQARSRETYDDLVESELTAYLGANPDSFDWIVSADTLCYFGDVSALLDASMRALRPGGHLVFTVELAEETSASPYVLHAHGRYCHRRSYVESALRSAGFVDVRIELASARSQKGVAVPGLVVTANR